MNFQHSRKHGEVKHDGKRAACPTNRTVTTETLRQVPQSCGIPSDDGTQGDNFGRAPYKSEAERRAYFARTVPIGLMLRNATSGRSEGAPIRFCETNPFRFRVVFVISILDTVTYALAVAFANWVRFGKRTQFRGVNEGGKHVFW